MKNLKNLFTALLLLCSTITFAEKVTIDGINYDVDTYTQQAMVSEGDYSGEIVIPSEITYNNVTYSVTSIRYQAFDCCFGLTSITIPNSVTSIGDEAFSSCSGLTSITIPNSVTSIGTGAFQSCSGLTSITIPNSVTSIEDGMFSRCSSLTSITIPNSVTSIGYEAFEYCDGLTSITIPNSVTSIEDYAFYSCDGLTSVTIGNSVTSIDYAAFAYCSSLISVTIGNSVTSIEDCAFYGCDKITEIKVVAEKPISADISIFTSDVYDNATMYIPNGTKSLYEEEEPWNKFSNIVEMNFTNIKEIAEQRAGNKAIYDLSGRVAENPTNGIYIVNGKKVLVK